MARSDRRLGLMVAGLVCLASVAARHAPADEPAEARRGVPEALERLSRGEGDLKAFSVTYSDIHPFHGGISLTIHGDGVVEQKALRVPLGTPRKVEPDAIRRLAALLLEQQAWQQRTPERATQPDESRASLTIRHGTSETRIWEWFNDLEKTKRIVVIRQRMKQDAWKDPAQPKR